MTFFGGLWLVHRKAVKQSIAAGAAQCFLGASSAFAARGWAEAETRLIIYFLVSAEQPLERGPDAFDCAAGALHAFSTERAESFGDVLNAYTELSGHRRCDARGQTFV